MSSHYANVSVPTTALSVPVGLWPSRVGQAVRRALVAVVQARPSQGLTDLAARCEALQPALARELRAAAARVNEA